MAPTCATARWTPCPRAPHSLEARLLCFLFEAIVCGTLLQLALARRSALAEANQIFEYHLQQTEMAPRPSVPSMPERAQEDESTEFVVQIWSPDGLRVFESSVGAALPQRAVLGLSNVRAHVTIYRVFSVQTRQARRAEQGQRPVAGGSRCGGRAGKCGCASHPAARSR